MLAEAFRDALYNLDIEAMRRLAMLTMPHVPQASDADVLASMHMARTQAESMPLVFRLYSHNWLTERALPSQLPDALKPRTQRVEQKIVTGVGLSVGFSAAELKPAGDLIRGAGEAVVHECYADGREDPDYVRPRMMEAVMRERKALFGRWKPA